MIAALTALDMLKPLDPKLEITETRVLEKSGGKSLKRAPEGLRAAVVVCSDSVHAGRAQDRSGLAIAERLRGLGLAHVSVEVVPDEPERIQARARAWIQERADLVLFTGGTGLSPRDRTPETIAPLLEREIPGIMETARRYGQDRTPLAMLSRGVAGFCGQTLLLTLPGSLKGAEETMDALFPSLLHLFEVRAGSRHDAPGP
jgi:molybdenum cofactor synthesis domain-containing protein